VCDLETSRIGAPYIYIYIYDISSLRVKANKITLNSDDKKLHETLYYLRHLCLAKYRVL